MNTQDPFLCPGCSQGHIDDAAPYYNFDGEPCRLCRVNEAEEGGFCMECITWEPDKVQEMMENDDE